MADWNNVRLKIRREGVEVEDGFQKTSILKVCLREWSRNGRDLNEEEKIRKLKAWKTKTRLSSSERRRETGEVWCVHEI